MTWRPFVAALLLPVACTAATLAGVARNRAGGREPIVLSEREVFASSRTDDRSAATLWLSWRPAAGSAREVRVSRTLPREGFAVLELDGAAFRGLTFEREAEREGASRLVVVDADADADVLARRYPDGRTHLITAATLRFVPGRPPDADAVIGISPQRIHVPREWAAELPRPDRETGRASRPFEVELRYGSNYEPWVTRISARSARSTPEVAGQCKSVSAWRATGWPCNRRPGRRAS